MIVCMTKHFVFHIRWICVLRLLYFNFFTSSICIIFLSDGIATSINKQTIIIIITTTIIKNCLHVEN
jgi:hypothetical protein